MHDMLSSLGCLLVASRPHSHFHCNDLAVTKAYCKETVCSKIISKAPPGCSKAVKHRATKPLVHSIIHQTTVCDSNFFRNEFVVLLHFLEHIPTVQHFTERNPSFVHLGELFAQDKKT